MPAWPSSSALNPLFRSRMASGLFWRISLAQATPSSSSAATGTTHLRAPFRAPGRRRSAGTGTRSRAPSSADNARKVARAEPPVKAAHRGPDLPEHRVVGRNRQVANDVVQWQFALDAEIEIVNRRNMTIHGCARALAHWLEWRGGGVQAADIAV